MSSTETELAERLAGARVRALDEVHGGRNSRVYRVELEDGSRAALKRYFRHPGDPRDRLGVEWRALEFLDEHGLRRVPRPLARDEAANAALYEWLDGSPVEGVSEVDVDDGAAFLAAVAALAQEDAARALPDASEACINPAHVLAVLERRRSRVGRAHGLAPFLAEVDAVVARMRARAVPSARLPRAEQILSPSDWGFHNAVRRPDGSLSYLDFEYFGWDDPAKLVCDTLLHPGMALTDELRRTFVATFVPRLPHAERVLDRIQRVYPLHALKWTLILLNEFVPDDHARRRFAGSAVDEAGRAGQLAKARALLRTINEDDGRFPYRP